MVASSGTTKMTPAVPPIASATAAKRFNLDFAVQEVLREKGRARDDVRLDYRFDCLPALLSQEPLEHARGQLAKCFIDRGENRKGPLTLEHLIHARGLKQVQEAGEPAILLRGLDDVSGLRGPGTERYRYSQCNGLWQCGIAGHVTLPKGAIRTDANP